MKKCNYQKNVQGDSLTATILFKSCDHNFSCTNRWASISTKNMPTGQRNLKHFLLIGYYNGSKEIQRLMICNLVIGCFFLLIWIKFNGGNSTYFYEYNYKSARESSRYCRTTWGSAVQGKMLVKAPEWPGLDIWPITCTPFVEWFDTY